MRNHRPIETRRGRPGSVASGASVLVGASPSAIFAGIHLLGWRRLPGWAHWWSGVPIALAGIFGAMSVIAANPSCTPQTRPVRPAHRPGAALVIAAGACGLAVLTLLTIGWLYGVRIIAAAGVAAVIWGCGVAPYPVLLPSTP